MNLDEKLNLFDTYLESIDGIRADIKPEIRLLSRYVLEAEAGVQTAETSDDLISMLRLNDIEAMIGDPNKINELQELVDKDVRIIDTVRARTDLNKLNIDAALAKINTFPNGKEASEQINHEIEQLKSSMNRFMTFAERKEYIIKANALKERLDKVNNLNKFIDRLVTALNQLNQDVLHKRQQAAHIREFENRDILLGRNKIKNKKDNGLSATELIEQIDAMFTLLTEECRKNATDISTYMKAVAAFNQRKMPLDNLRSFKLTKDLKGFNINGSKVTYTVGGSDMLPSVTIPLHIAYEFSLPKTNPDEWYIVDKTDNNWALAENCLVGGQLVNRWYVNADYDNADTMRLFAKNEKTEHRVKDAVSASKIMPDELFARLFKMLNDVF